MGEYHAATGAAINTTFIALGGSGPTALKVSGSNLFVAGISQTTVFDASSGIANNPPNLLPGSPDIAVAGNTVYICGASSYPNGVIAQYDLTTGLVENPSFIQGLGEPEGLALAGNSLYVANSGIDTIGEFDATTGAPINANLITTGLNNPQGLAVSGNDLFVANYGSGTIGEYDLMAI